MSATLDQTETLQVDEIEFSCPWCERLLKLSIWEARDKEGPCPLCDQPIRFSALLRSAERMECFDDDCEEFSSQIGDYADSPPAGEPDCDALKELVPSDDAPEPVLSVRREFPWMLWAGLLFGVVACGGLFYVASSHGSFDELPSPTDPKESVGFSELELTEQQSLLKEYFAGEGSEKTWPSIHSFVEDSDLKSSTGSAALLVSKEREGGSPPVIARFVYDQFGDLKLDERLLSQSNDDSLKLFCENVNDEERVFLVGARRISNKNGRAVCVALSNLSSDSTVVRVALDVRSELGKKMAEILAPGEALPLVVRLSWSRRPERVQLTGFELAHRL